MAPRTPKASEPQTAKAAKSEKPARARPAVAAARPALKAVEPAVPPAASGPGLKLKDLVDSVALATGGKKADVKKAVEATLAALGEALSSGKALAVPPLGKLRVVKNKGAALTLKLRRADSPKAAGLALANDGEDS